MARSPWLFTLLFGIVAADPPPGKGAPLEPTPAELRTRVLRAMGDDLPGVAACVVVRGAVVWCDGFGVTDVSQPTPVTADTPFLLASVTKVVTATVLMQLRDEGLLDLDAPLPGIAARHPGNGAAFTPRALLTHTSGIADSDMMDAFYAWDGDASLTLAAAVRGYLLPKGRWYSADDNFAGAGPGEAYAYSNMGIATAGYLVERVAGGDLRAESRARIFRPLGMTHSFWRLADAPAGVVIAMPHEPAASGPKPVGHYHFADYPDGGLFSSARDLARFLAALASGGQPVLAPRTLAEMLTPQVPGLEPTQGIVWYLEETGARPLWGHNGSMSGVATQILLDPKGRAALVVLTNGESDAEDGGLGRVLEVIGEWLLTLERDAGRDGRPALPVDR